MLMFLNRDSEAYLYCKYWLLHDDAPEAVTIKEILTDKDRPTFPSEESSPHCDIFQDCPEANDIPLHYLLALLIVKMRLVDKLQAMKLHNIPLDATTSNVGYETIDEALTVQQAQLEKLRNETSAKNAHVLPSLVIPERARDILPEDPGIGDVSEYHGFAMICAIRVRGARAMLEL